VLSAQRLVLRDKNVLGAYSLRRSACSSGFKVQGLVFPPNGVLVRYDSILCIECLVRSAYGLEPAAYGLGLTV